MKKLFLFLVLSLFFVSVSFGQWTVKTVPNPIINGGFVSNPDSILLDETVSTINEMIKAAVDSGYAEVGVVVLNSIGEIVPKEFASELFNYWGIGNKETENGLLILMVMDQRIVSFETGYGIEAILTDAKCYEIQQEYMVPAFKEGDYDTGVIEGVAASLLELGSEVVISDDSYDNTYTSDDTDEFGYVSDVDSTSKFKRLMNSSVFLFYIVADLVLIILFVILYFTSLLHTDRYKRYQTLRLFSLVIFAIIFPIPFIFIFLFVRMLLDRWRNTTRISPSGKEMRKLNEVEDDNYLKSGQITEEQIKSIDYDVWITDDTDEILILAYKRWFSGFTKCPKCKYKTYYLEYDKVITPATYTSSGTGEKKHSCKHCSHSVTRTYTIPKKERTSTTSSSYRSSGGGSYSSSSWGGGSSGGGGASSSW